MSQRFTSGLLRYAALGLLVFPAGCGGETKKPVVIEQPVYVGSGSARREVRDPKEIREIYSSPVKQEELLRRSLKYLESATLSPDPQARAHAFEALVQVPRSLDKVIERGLVDENYGVRSIAAMSVGKAELKGHAGRLELLLEDESPFVSTAAAFALYQTGHPVNLDFLAAHLLESDDPGLRAHVAYLLGEIGDESALPLLVDAAGVSMPRALPARVKLMELQFSEAMVKLGRERQLEPIRAALYPATASELEATALAVQILGEVKDRSSRGSLAQLSERAGPNGELLPPEILLAIAISMAKLGDQNGWFLADLFWQHERAVIRADSASVYGWTNRTEDLAKLEHLLSDPSEVVGVAAAGGIVRKINENW